MIFNIVDQLEKRTCDTAAVCCWCRRWLWGTTTTVVRKSRKICDRHDNATHSISCNFRKKKTVYILRS